MTDTTLLRFFGVKPKDHRPFDHTGPLVDPPAPAGGSLASLAAKVRPVMSSRTLAVVRCGRAPVVSERPAAVDEQTWCVATSSGLRVTHRLWRERLALRPVSEMSSGKAFGKP